MDLTLNTHDLTDDSLARTVGSGIGDRAGGPSGWRVVEVSGDVDVYVAAQLSSFLAEQVAHQGAVRAAAVISAAPAGGEEEPSGSQVGLVLDLRGITFIDSAGLGVLVGAYKRARGPGVVMRLVATSAQLVKMLQITGLQRVLAPHPDIAAAICSKGP